MKPGIKSNMSDLNNLNVNQFEASMQNSFDADIIRQREESHKN
jgi:hypothetical protein